MKYTVSDPRFPDLFKEGLSSLLVLFYSFIIPLGCKSDIGDSRCSDVLTCVMLLLLQGRERTAGDYEVVMRGKEGVFQFTYNVF